MRMNPTPMNPTQASARFYGFIDAPTEVLAWRDTGVACE